jgi:hypothetical protein
MGITAIVTTITAITSTITPIDDARSKLFLRPDQIAALFAMALGACVACFSICWLLHDREIYRLHALAQDISYGRPVADAELAGALITAIDLNKTGDLDPTDLNDAGLVATTFAQRNASRPLILPSLLAVAEQLLRSRLEKAPADGNSWLRLAAVRTARFGLDALSLRALTMSWLVAPREFSLMWPSLEFRVSHWQELPLDQRREAADLVTGLWHKPPEQDRLKRYILNLPVDTRRSMVNLLSDRDVIAGLRPSTYAIEPTNNRSTSSPPAQTGQRRGEAPRDHVRNLR